MRVGAAQSTTPSLFSALRFIKALASTVINILFFSPPPVDVPKKRQYKRLRSLTPCKSEEA